MSEPTVVWDPSQYSFCDLEVNQKRGTAKVTIAYKLKKSQNPGAAKSPLVVCVHGIGGFSFTFDATAEALLTDFDVLLYDQPGRGYSPYTPSFDFSGKGHSEALHELIRSVCVADREVVLIGHSMGGGIVAIYTHDHPEKVVGTAYLCPAGMMPGAQFKVLRAIPCFHGAIKKNLGKAKNQEKAVKDSVYDPANCSTLQHVSAMHNMAQDNNETMEALFYSALRFPLAQLHGIVKKVAADGKERGRAAMLVWGENDGMVPYKSCYSKWCRAFGIDVEKGADESGLVTAKVYEKAGHALTNEDHVVNDLNGLLLDFVRKVAK